MKKLLILFVSLAGCSSILPVQTERQPQPTTDKQTQTKPTDLMSVSQLLVVRDVMCDLPMEKRSERLQYFKTTLIDSDNLATNLSISSKEKAQHQMQIIYALMLTSCELDRTPSLFNRFLEKAENTGDWPEDYQALIDLLIEVQRVIQSADTKYHDLVIEYEKTIQGIKNIEVEADNITVPNQLPR